MRTTPVWIVAALAFVPGVAAQVPALAVPEQVHVTLGEEPGTLVVQWAVVGAPYAPLESPIVEWTSGDSGGQAQAVHAGVVSAGALNLQAATRYETHVYAATIGPLEPSAAVQYRAGSPERGFTRTFQVALPPGDGQSLRFAAYADIGIDVTAPDGSRDPTASDHPAHDIQELALSYRPQLIVMPGDLPYVNSREGWDAFMRFLEPAAATVPLMPTIGNHEWDEELGYAQFLNEFALPNDEETYVFRAGPVTFIALNSDVICGNHFRGAPGSPVNPCDDGEDGQLNVELTSWLEAALSEAQNDSAPWTIVYEHHPALSYGRHNIDWAVHTYWMPLFSKYEADLVISGHDHVYSRSFPTHGRAPAMTGSEYPQGTAPVYVVVGGGGRPPYTVPQEAGPAWHAHGESVNHFGLVDVNETRLSFQAIRVDGSIMDTFTIVAREEGPAAEAVNVPSAGLLAFAAVGIVLVMRRRIKP